MDATNLLQEYYRELLAYARRYNKEEAEDIVQDLFVKCSERPIEDCKPGILFAMVRTIAYNKRRRDDRRRKRERKYIKETQE